MSCTSILEYFVYLLCVYFEVYMFGWLCRATYCSVVSTSMLGVSHAVQNEKNSRSVHRVIACICYIYFDVWCITCWGIIFHTAVVVACAIFTHGFSWGRGYRIWVFRCLFVVSTYMFGWICRATCSFVSTSMLGTSHAVQSEKKL